MVHQCLLQQVMELAFPLATPVRDHLCHATKPGQYMLQEGCCRVRRRLVRQRDPIRMHSMCLLKYSTHTMAYVWPLALAGSGPNKSAPQR